MLAKPSKYNRSLSLSSVDELNSPITKNKKNKYKKIYRSNSIDDTKLLPLKTNNNWKYIKDKFKNEQKEILKEKELKEQELKEQYELFSKENKINFENFKRHYTDWPMFLKVVKDDINRFPFYNYLIMIKMYNIFLNHYKFLLEKYKIYNINLQDFFYLGNRFKEYELFQKNNNFNINLNIYDFIFINLYQNSNYNTIYYFPQEFLYIVYCNDIKYFQLENSNH
jgi:hypothetical protein